MRVELSDEEATLLRELLEGAFADLRGEVYRTEGAEWKRALKAREHLLDGLIAKLRAGT